MKMNKLAFFQAARNYALYYGAGNEDKLSVFDVAIVEPAGQQAASLQKIKDSGTLVLAYLSVVELNPAAPEVKLFRDTDFLNVAGQPLMNEAYGNYLMDLRSNRWQGLLRHKAGSLIEHSGYDGLFLDTIGDIESERITPESRDALIMAAVNMISRFRSSFPGAILVQNCGLEKLCNLTASMINGICWENPPLGEITAAPWVRAVTRRLVHLKERHGLKIMLLVEENGAARAPAGDGNLDGRCRTARIIAGRHGFLLYRAPLGYVRDVYAPCNLPEA